MSSCVKLTRFELRRNLASVWTSTNPILLAGEPGVETDTGQMKVGNGTDRWNSLVYVGKGGGGATGPLGFIKSSDNIYGPGLSYQRDLVTFYEDGGPKTIRKWLSYNHTLTGQPMFAVQLADFSPSFTSTTTPGASLNWDDPCTGFSVSVNNPSDFLTQYISSVNSIEQQTGTVSALSLFTAGPKSQTPAGGIDWSQTFTTNGTGVIRSTTDGTAGGMASAKIRYNSFSGTESLYTPFSTISVTWATPGLVISTDSLSGRTFLKTYTSTPYSLSVSGITNPSNYVHIVSATQGTVSNSAGNGTFTFTTPIHKDNTGTIRRVSTSTTLTRPADVTGNSYSVVLTGSSIVSASFTYPSFWLFTTGVSTPPVLSNIVSGTDFVLTSDKILGDGVRTFEDYIENINPTAAAFWFCVKADVPQPSSFRSGSGPGLLSGVGVTKGNTVDLKPDPMPSGYVAVSYALYGITVPSGEIYISIT